MKVDELWNRILPLPIGTKVRVSKNTIAHADKLGREELIGRIGVVIDYAQDTWKHRMILDHYYPPAILKETIYVLAFRGRGRYAYRCIELEVIQE